MTDELQYSDADLAQLEQKVESDTTGYRYIADLADAYAERGRWQNAISAYQDAIALEPKDALLYHDLGITHEEAGELEKAEENYRKALSLNPRLATDYLEMGSMCKAEGRFDEAGRHFQLCSQHSENSSEIEEAQRELKALRGEARPPLHRDIVRSDAAHTDADGDDWVRVALFPSNYDWLLRYDIDSDYRDGIFTPSFDGSDFDFSCSRDAPVAGLIEQLV